MLQDHFTTATYLLVRHIVAVEALVSESFENKVSVDAIVTGFEAS